MIIRREDFIEGYAPRPAAGELVAINEPADLTDSRDPQAPLPRLKAFTALYWLDAQGLVKTLRIRSGANDIEIRQAVRALLPPEPESINHGQRQAAAIHESPAQESRAAEEEDNGQRPLRPEGAMEAGR